jgi:hypothetical protein
LSFELDSSCHSLICIIRGYNLFLFFEYGHEAYQWAQTAATAKACYVCSRPTTIVLATINTTDFLYACPGHLSDQGFASLVRDNPSPNVTLTPEEIRKVKEEWEEKQKEKVEKEKEKVEKEKQKEKVEKDKTDDNRTKPVAPSRPGPATSTPTHERYVLHRDFFASQLLFLLWI